MSKKLRLSCVTLGAEYLAMGYLLRRNILTYKAPDGYEGYDLICINPDPRHKSKALRVQVKSRYATDGDGGFLIRKESLEAFDYLIAVSLNIGFFCGKGKKSIDGLAPPVFCTFPAQWIRENHKISPAGWGSIRTKSLTESEKQKFRNEAGFEAIAKDLKIPYPSKDHLR